MSRADRVFEGCETQQEMEARILGKRVPRAALKGKDVSLPIPYAKRTHILERDVLKACKDVLQMSGVWHRRIEGTGKIIGSGENCKMIPGQLAGMPDLLCILKGRFVAIEVKAPGGTLSAGQYGTLSSIHEAGGIAIVCCNANSLLEWLRKGFVTAHLDRWLIVL